MSNKSKERVVENYKYGKRHGEYFMYDQHGQLIEQKYYIDGKLNGEHVKYYNNGKIRLRCNYKNDEIVGEYCEWSYEGFLICNQTYIKKDEKTYHKSLIKHAKYNGQNFSEAEYDRASLNLITSMPL